MATAVDICNMALALLGDTATVTNIDPPEGSAQADHCNRFYPIALKEVLAEAPWSFAMRRADPAMLANDPLGQEDRGVHAFVLPADCVRLVNLESKDMDSPRHIMLTYTIEEQENQKVAIVRAEDIWVRYVTSEVHASSFPSWFVTALVHKLASYLAGPVIPGTTGLNVAEAQIKLYEYYLERAIQKNAIEQVNKTNYISPFHGDAQEENSSVFY